MKNNLVLIIFLKTIFTSDFLDFDDHQVWSPSAASEKVTRDAAMPACDWLLGEILGSDWSRIDFYGPVFRIRSGVKCYFMCHRDFRPSINITAQIRQNSSDLKLLLIGSKTIFKLSTFSFKLREKL